VRSASPPSHEHAAAKRLPLLLFLGSSCSSALPAPAPPTPAPAPPAPTAAAAVRDPPKAGVAGRRPICPCLTFCDLVVLRSAKTCGNG